MIRDPQARAEALAGWLVRVEDALWRDLEDSGLLPAPPAGEPHRARLEWQCLALYAGVRGLVAAGGFNTETVAAVDRLHGCMAEAWERESPPLEAPGPRHARVAERYAEYGRIGQELEARGAAQVAARLGEACAAHVARPAAAAPPLAEQLGALHDALVEGATAAVRDAPDATAEPQGGVHR